jgi:hypothetical protein
MLTRVLVLVPFLGLAACGGGGGGGSVQGLTIPSQVTLIDANTGGSVHLPRHVLRDTLTDYDADQTRFWVHDECMGPLDTINSILSALDQTNYDDPSVINQGPYLALIKWEQDGQAQDGDRGGQQYQEWVVDSTRASDAAPHVVKVWIKEQEEDDSGNRVDGIIYVRVVINAAPTAALPYGDFTVYFKELPATAPDDSPNTLFEGYLTTVARTDGQAEFMFYNSHGDPDLGPPAQGRAMREAARLIGDPAAQTGRAYTERNEQSQQWQEHDVFQVQYNANYVAKQDVNNSVEVLDRNNFNTNVWRYGVYDAATGMRVVNQGGFPVETLTGDRGWADYNGIWFPEGVSITDGQSLLRRSFQNNTTTPYTAVVVAGKLEKRTRSSITLADVTNEELETWDQANAQQVLIAFNGTDWMEVATRSGGPDWTRLQTPINADTLFNNGMWVNMWSPARGSVEMTWTQTPAPTTDAFRWTITTIKADSPDLLSGDLTLYAYWDMLKADITQAQANFTGGQTPYYPPAGNVGQGMTYVFNATTLLLTLGGQPCTLQNGVTVTQGPGMNGFRCGPLMTVALNNFNEMQNQTVTYSWATGPADQPWNQLRTLKDSNNMSVVFQPPIAMDYTHHENGSPFDGRVFNLQWNGESLNGIPYQESEADHRWYPLLTIPSGSLATGNGTTYKLKQLEGEQQMVAVADPTAVMASEGFDLTTPLTPPTAGLWQDPAIGPRPVVTAPPRFVAGVDQTAAGN